uniref:Uncharacterized protein n=1 Tax=Romanomermis culicivorax TaxID=13658 RepID=A0A915J1K3_ROMCU
MSSAVVNAGPVDGYGMGITDCVKLLLSVDVSDGVGQKISTRSKLQSGVSRRRPTPDCRSISALSDCRPTLSDELRGIPSNVFESTSLPIGVRGTNYFILYIIFIDYVLCNMARYYERKPDAHKYPTN